MSSRTNRGIMLSVLLGVLGMWGCGESSSAIHLIPAGYTGPVVIVFEDPKGAVPRSEGARVLYEIPSTGVLRLSTPKPKAGWATINYYHVFPDGSRQEIPYHTEAETLQVFANVDGTTGRVGSEQRTKWTAYVVGIPDKRDDWVALREGATDAALGEVVHRN